MPNRKTYTFPLLLIFCFSIGIALPTYFLERENFNFLITVFGCLFLLYAWSMKYWRQFFHTFLLAALVFRLIPLVSLPELSDDFYRFIWDGRLWINGENPYLQLPQHYIEKGIDIQGISQNLYEQLNSKGYYSIYPPVNQYIFGIATFLFPHHILAEVIVMRTFIILAEAGSVFLIYKLLQHFSLPKENLLFYALNPLVIIELTGNLHFEAVMIFFLLWSVWLLVQRQWLLSAVCLGLSISTKLIPLMFIPLLIRFTGWKKTIKISFIALVTSCLLFLPFLEKELFINFSSSLDLYFRKFEFNASIYYIIRWIGYQVKGYNIIQTAGIGLAVITFLSIVLLAVRKVKSNRNQFFRNALFAQTIFYLLATTVHPWYVTSLVAWSSFTKWRYPIVWSALVTLSYYTYTTSLYRENLWLVFIEYAIVFGWIIYEAIHMKRQTHLS